MAKGGHLPSSVYERSHWLICSFTNSWIPCHMSGLCLELCIRNQSTALSANVNSRGAESVGTYRGKPEEQRHFPFRLPHFSPCNPRPHPSFQLFIFIRQSPNITARTCLIVSGHLCIEQESAVWPEKLTGPFPHPFFFLTPHCRWLDYVIWKYS